MTNRNPNPPELLTPAEVAEAFRVDPKTVTRWAIAGKIRCVRTIGGHRRYYADEVNALLAGLPATATVTEPLAPVAEARAMYKQCSSCGTAKPERDFSAGSYRCRACTVALSGATPEAGAR